MAVTLVDYLTQLKNSPGSQSQIATTIWGAVSRTLTNDPATMAGLANLVWTHASRSLTADPATDGGAASLVWTHSTRNLTGVGVSMTPIAVINQSVPNGALADLRPAAGNFRYGMWGVVVQSINWQTGHYSGAQFFENNIASGAQALIAGIIGNVTFGFYAFNNGVSAGTYNLSGFDWAA